MKQGLKFANDYFSCIFREMAKNFKVGSQVVGAIKCNLGWNGVVTEIKTVLIKKKFVVQWTNGKSSECSSRGIRFPGDPPPKKAKIATKEKEPEPQQSDSESEEHGQSDEESFEEERDGGDEDDA